MRRKRNLKLPNGLGSIIYLGDNRRNPYGAVKTIGWTQDGKQIRKYVGVAPTYNDAFQILLDYNKMPFNLDHKNIIVKDVYNKLLVILTEQYNNGKISKTSYKCLKSAYNQHLYKLDNENIVTLKRKELQDIIDKSGLKYTGRNYIKILFTKMIDFCNDELELNINTDIYKKLKIGEKEKSTKHKIMLIDDIHYIDELSKTDDIAKIIMIYLYTGLRPSELLLIEIKNVFLNDDYMIGGIKTDAGIDRIIPIHSKIKPFIEYFYNPNNKYLIVNKSANKITYDAWKKIFKKFMEMLGYNYIPHDTRHTFATKCEDAGISDVNIKILMGHSLANDVTNDVYIHKTIEKLRNEIERIIY